MEVKLANFIKENFQSLYKDPEFVKEFRNSFISTHRDFYHRNGPIRIEMRLLDLLSHSWNLYEFEEGHHILTCGVCAIRIKEILFSQSITYGLFHSVAAHYASVECCDVNLVRSVLSD